MNEETEHFEEPKSQEPNDSGSESEESTFDEPKAQDMDEVQTLSEDDFSGTDEEAALDLESLAEGYSNELYSSEESDQDMFTSEDESIMEIKRQVEDSLMAQSEGVRAESAYEGIGNIVGVGYGEVDEQACCTSGLEPGAMALNLYVAEPASVDEVKSVIVDTLGVQAASCDSVPVNVQVTGEIDAFSHRFRIRPAPGGVSCGHYRITAGTLGCLAVRRLRRGSRLLVLSNNHVLANSNKARFGDAILQPGPADGGRMKDRIAILERFVPIRFNRGVNYVDCATGWAWPKRVRKELVYLNRGRRRFFRIGRRPVACRRGMLVGKSGRTTQLTVGRITDCSLSVRVNYGSSGIAFFRDQIGIRAQRGNFSAGGDSGSVIWTWNRKRNPVGLLFAGGGGLTIANKMGRVLRALGGIPLYT